MAGNEEKKPGLLSRIWNAFKKSLSGFKNLFTKSDNPPPRPTTPAPGVETIPKDEVYSEIPPARPLTPAPGVETIPSYESPKAQAMPGSPPPPPAPVKFNVPKQDPNARANLMAAIKNGGKPLKKTNSNEQLDAKKPMIASNTGPGPEEKSSVQSKPTNMMGELSAALKNRKPSSDVVIEKNKTYSAAPVQDFRANLKPASARQAPSSSAQSQPVKKTWKEEMDEKNAKNKANPQKKSL